MDRTTENRSSRQDAPHGLEEQLALALAENAELHRQLAENRGETSSLNATDTGVFVEDDYRGDGFAGRQYAELDLQHEMLNRRSGLPIIVITGHTAPTSNIEALKQSAFTFLEKPYAGNALLEAISNALAAADQ